MVSEADHRAVADFLYREARLADEARYAEWLELWTDDAVYWVPATTDPAATTEAGASGKRAATRPTRIPTTR